MSSVTMVEVWSLEEACARRSVQLLAPFSCLLLAAVAVHPRMFTRQHGRAHRLMGSAHLFLLALGLADVVAYTAPQPLRFLLSDLLLCVSGTALTLTAASGFGHRNVKNTASGALEKHTTISHAEMVEHAFYQALNGVQIVYLHTLPHMHGYAARSMLCMAATAPWLVRHLFPVHSFRSNYVGRPLTRESFMYWVKKWQYVLYKHVLLHGLNICAAMRGGIDASSRTFRLYWLCLNASYVLEFFLQTLVKRGYLRQGRMLALNALLMGASTLAAVPVLLAVHPLVAAGSLALNFWRRGGDVSNVALLLLAIGVVN
jgi:hypothetical protein